MASYACFMPCCTEVCSELSPLFSLHVEKITTPPTARNTAAASNGATGPRLMSVTR